MSEQNQMTFLKKKLPLILAVVAVISLAGAVLLLALYVPHAAASYKKVLGSIIASLMIVLSLLIAYYLWMLRDTDPNFFLFDRAKKRNIPVEDLTFKIVNDRMTFFLTLVASTPEELWSGNALENEQNLGIRRVYRPLLAYKMLYDLADKDVNDYWGYLLTSTPETVDSICRALEQNGEKEMVKAFRYIMENYRDNQQKIKDFVRGNLRYIRGRMVGYVKNNIDLFY